MYTVGSWIKVADTTLSSVDFTGYILEHYADTKIYKIQLTKNKHGKNIKGNLRVNIHEDGIYSADLEDGFDTSFLQELELDWCLVQKNEKWFFELVKELENKGGNENVKR